MKAPGIVFHTSVAPHVRETVKAFEYAGQLACFFTTLYDGRPPLVSWPALLTAKRQQRLRQRRIPELGDEKVHTYPWWEMARLAVPGPAPWRELLSDSIWEWADLAFARHVGRHLPEHCGFVYGYDHSSLETFLAAKARGIRCIYEVSSPEWNRMQELTRSEMERMGHPGDAYLRLCEKRQPRRTARCRKEWELADVVIVNSEVTRLSFAETGHRMDHVRVIPLGAPPADENALQKWKEERARVRLIWVGPFMPRKGARILREAMSHPDWPEDAGIDVYGSLPMIGASEGFPADRVHWHGPVSQSEVWAAMARADALLLPTLADGFGMAITEAWSHGLPVLTTPQAGAAPSMHHGLHGLRFEAGSASALVEAVREFKRRREEWPVWRFACLELARSLGWEHYHARLVAAALDETRGQGRMHSSP